VKRRDESRVVISGVGPVTPIGVGREQFWAAAAGGRSGTSALTHLPLSFPVDSLRSRVVARVPLDTGECSVRHLALAQRAMQLALKDAGLDSLRNARSGVVIGTAVAATAEMETAYLIRHRGSLPRDAHHELGLSRLLPFQTAAHELAAQCGCKGTVLTVATGCTAGIDAIGMAFDLVRSGYVDVVLAGATDAPITPVVFAAFDAIGALTRSNDRPEQASRPFDRERDGFVLAEGAACVVVEEREHALERGALIYAELEGFASLSNGYHMTDLPADGQAMAKCLREAMSDAHLDVSHVDHVSAHGSSTPQNDLCETNALKRALGAHCYDVTVNSIKSMTGHALGASNAIEIVGCALSLLHQYVLPTINLQQAGEGCDLDYVANRGRPARTRHLLKMSSGFSGIHSVLAMGAP
jgi:3-oxoacyl-(acyl-carrier-protein) synthase